MAYRSDKMIFTDTDMLRDGKTKYVIVLPANASPVEKRAAHELEYFFKKATGVTLDIIEDIEANYNVAAYYFSIGNTQLLNKLNLPLDDFFKEDGYRLYSKGNMIFFAGTYGKGCIFAVYEFLERMFNYKYYAAEEYSLEEKKVLKVYVFDIEYSPDIARRSLGFYETEGRDMEYTYRLRLGNTLYNDWLLYAHTYFKILPKIKYFEKNRSWYSPDGSNLCVSNPEMRAEFIEQVKLIIEKGEGSLIMLGQEDNFTFCTCDECKRKIKKYGSPSGLAMEFTNEVAREVGVWLKDNYPERRIKFVAFAYNATFIPPAKFNEVKGLYQAIDKKVEAEPNVAVMVVPYNSVYSANFYDESKNKFVKEGLLGWQAVSKDLQIWCYCTIFQNYLLPFNDWDAVKGNYKLLSDMNISFLFDQGPHNTKTCTFNYLRQFVHSRLMWNINFETKALIEEFTNAFYKEAAPFMRYYLNIQRARCAFNEEYYQKHAYAFDSFRELADSKYWPKEYVLACNESFLSAFKEIEKIKKYDEEKAKLIFERVNIEYLSVRYLMIYLHPELFEDVEKEKTEFLQDCKKYEIKFNE